MSESPNFAMKIGIIDLMKHQGMGMGSLASVFYIGNIGVIFYIFVQTGIYLLTHTCPLTAQKIEKNGKKNCAFEMSFLILP